MRRKSDKLDRLMRGFFRSEDAGKDPEPPAAPASEHLEMDLMESRLNRCISMESVASSSSAPEPRGCLNTSDMARYLSKDITDAERDSIEAHVAGCSRCASIMGSVIRRRRADET